MKIIILGSVPSKKNSVALFPLPDGRWMKAPGKLHRKWHKVASKQLYGIKPVENIKGIDIVIFAADRRKGDLTNKAESVMDLLVDNKIIPDDNWYVVSSVHLKFGGVDKNNPRAEVCIL